jgi:hypothetical protein
MIRAYGDASAVASPVMRISQEEQERNLEIEISKIETASTVFMQRHGTNITTKEQSEALQKEFFSNFMVEHKIPQDYVPKTVWHIDWCYETQVQQRILLVRSTIYDYIKSKKLELAKMKGDHRLRESMRERQRIQHEQALAASVRMSNFLLDEPKPAPEPDLLQFSRVQELEGLFTPSP